MKTIVFCVSTGPLFAWTSEQFGIENTAEARVGGQKARWGWCATRQRGRRGQAPHAMVRTGAGVNRCSPPPRALPRAERRRCHSQGPSSCSSGVQGISRLRYSSIASGSLLTSPEKTVAFIRGFPPRCTIRSGPTTSVEHAKWPQPARVLGRSACTCAAAAAACAAAWCAAEPRVAARSASSSSAS